MPTVRNNYKIGRRGWMLWLLIGLLGLGCQTTPQKKETALSHMR
jgi:hypothetical protein